MIVAQIAIDKYTYVTYHSGDNVSNWRIWWKCNDGRFRAYESGHWGDACLWVPY